MVYALLVERVQQERAVIASLIAGGHDLVLPSIYDLDVGLGLIEKPASDLSPEQIELRQALGLRG